jgi:hypothetical protein
MRLMLARLLPRSLSGRMTLILVLGLLAAQFVSLLLHLQERAADAGRQAMCTPARIPGMDALPLRFLWHVSLTLGASSSWAWWRCVGPPNRCSSWPPPPPPLRTTWTRRRWP